jgi:hypothetical protein
VNIRIEYATDTSDWKQQKVNVSTISKFGRTVLNVTGKGLIGGVCFLFLTK